MKVVAKKWTKEDKREMSDVATEIHKLLTKRFKKDILKKAFVLNLMNKCYSDEVGLENTISISKGGSHYIDFKEMENIRKILYGMEMSELNVVLFRDEDYVWMQLYMGFTLKKPTVILSEDKDAEALSQIKKHPLIKEIAYVESFDNQEKLQKKTEEALERVLKGLNKDGVIRKN